ncbi:hypothetical protein FB45DRAFT_927805 [Roridomyces roridus]|uniref:Uncharacterized protein n=1 Tax=Roridomyces roridus TaxID=1738132 RepID=A0AAD7BIZ9_9AGAR|nr:hypothetical protein FB45DRAFT_927805 [Roridomyces roridus]
MAFNNPAFNIPFNNPAVGPNLPWLHWQVVAYPQTTYGIAYDINTVVCTLLPPNGWGGWSQQVYAQLDRALTAMGWFRNQWSYWVGHNKTPLVAWTEIWALQYIQPASKFATVIKHLCLTRMDHFAVLDISANAQLGSVEVPRIYGLVPRDLALAPNVVLQPPAGPVPPNGFRRPVGTRNTVQANNPAHWAR